MQSLLADDIRKKNTEGRQQPPNAQSQEEFQTSSYVCRRGHRTVVSLILTSDGGAIGGSSWDFCDSCSEGPNDVDRIRMPLEIFGIWLRAGTIDAEHYANLAHQVVSK